MSALTGLCALLTLLVMSGPSRAAGPLRWEQRAGYRVAELDVPKTGRTGFTLLPPEQTGIFFTNRLSYERAIMNQNLMNGAGLAAGDVDGDGLCDLFFCSVEGGCGLFRNLGDWKFEEVTRAAGVGCSNQLSRSAVFADLNGDGAIDLLVGSVGGPNACLFNDGHGHFTNGTQAAGLVLKAGCESMALADIDGDGTLDLYIANYGENTVLRGGGSFSVRDINGKPTVTGRGAKRLKIVDGLLIEVGEPHVLYLNNGKGIFTPVSWTEGRFLNEDGKPLKAAPPDLGLSVMMRDFNGDGFPDIYVCNDFQCPDRFWLNDGRGHFRAAPRPTLRSTSYFSMGVDVADIDRDGWDDFFVNDMISPHHGLQMTQTINSNPPPERVGEDNGRQQIQRNTLFLNRGDGTYANIASYAGVEASDWTWSGVFLDVDLDGYEDLLIATGHYYDTQDRDMQEKSPDDTGRVASMRGGSNLKDYPKLDIPNILFRNRGDRTFEEVSKAWGFDSTNVCHGIIQADLDNDGDLDVVVSCYSKPPLIYRNDSIAPRVAVRLKGKSPNTQGIGGKIKVLGGAVPMQSQEIICGGRYLSGDDPMRVFAAGTLTNLLTIEVTWRNGTRSVVEGALPNHIYEIDEAAAKEVQSDESKVQGPTSKVEGLAAASDTHHAPRTTQPPASPPNPQSAIRNPQFVDASALLQHTHHEDGFNDFDRQPLLHKALSHLGPGVAWYDLDGDGHDDLIVGSGRGGKLAVFRSDGKGGLSPWEAPAWAGLAADDFTGIVGWTPAGQERSLLVGVSNYELPDGSPAAVLRFQSGAASPAAASAVKSPAELPCVGVLACADLDGDGSLDLFVGGRVVPGRYPEGASSVIYRNHRGTLELDDANSRLLQKVGLVSGAVWSDLDGDGFPELILACEWGPVKIFHNDHGRLSLWDAPVSVAGAPPLATHNPQLPTLSQLTGWWNGVTTGDIDGDGRLDIIVSNWGLNSSYHQPTAKEPARLYYGDFDGNGTMDLLEAYSDPDSGRVVPRRDLQIMNRGLPLLRTRFPTHAAYSKADAQAVLGDAAHQAQELQAKTLASMLFLNRGDHFEARLLPAEAQYAPAFGVNVADFDGDGHEDIFLSQNFFPMRVEEPRLDSGRGLWLRGDGTGGLSCVPGQESGVIVYGDQRGSAVGDFDEDGRVDLVVTQNKDSTRLFRNERAKRGLRVRLSGPAGNPLGVGATMRLGFGQTMGPAREIHGGSGYWSQDSATQVMALPTAATSLWVRWPGGKVTTGAIPAGAREVVANEQGEVRMTR